MLLVALVLLMVLAGLPVLTGMAAMATCEECAPAAMPCGPSCPAVLSSMVAALMLATAGFVAASGRRRAGLVYAWSLDPPPRLA